MYVGGLMCQVANFTDTWISCLLPEGTGVALLVTVLIGSQVSRPVVQNGALLSPSVSFGAPQVTSLVGCSGSANAMSVIDCKRGGGDTLTIHVQPAPAAVG